MFFHPRSRKILGFNQNYDFAIFQKIGIFWGLTRMEVVPSNSVSTSNWYRSGNKA